MGPTGPGKEPMTGFQENNDPGSVPEKVTKFF
jgi:hypothetical protein